MSARMLAIYALTAMNSKKAVPGILQIAADRKEKDNADREVACRALGIIGDLSVVPDLVHLTYHYNRDTRFWAQISLVRLTGENFGRDVAAWRQWWAKQDGKPPIVQGNRRLGHQPGNAPGCRSQGHGEGGPSKFSKWPGNCRRRTDKRDNRCRQRNRFRRTRKARSRTSQSWRSRSTISRPTDRSGSR